MSSQSSQCWIRDFATPLAEGGEQARAVLGGKGASLAGMTQAGFHVPPGFTITTAACRHVMAHDGAWPDGLEEQLREHMAALESATGRQFGGPEPLLVSVRSGAAQSMPGMMDTLLNVGLYPGMPGIDDDGFWQLYRQFLVSFVGSAVDIAVEIEDQVAPRSQSEAIMAHWQEVVGCPFSTDPWDILRASIDAVFRSWTSARAAAYRRRHGLDDGAGTAVNIQVMFPSRSSGVVFTRDPNDPHSTHMVIEAAHGLGEAVVSGDVTPDRYLVSRDDPTQGEYFSGEAGREVAALGSAAAETEDGGDLVLARERIATLAELCLRVERWYGAPMDIEWGLAGGELALLQCRPIRGMDILLDVETGRQEEIARLRTLADGQRTLWVTHNLGETLAAPTPMTWDIVRDFMRGDGGFGLMYQDFGYRPAEAVRQDGFLELICGRIYAQVDRLATLFWGDLPLIYDLDQVAADATVLDGPPTALDHKRADTGFLLALPGTLKAMWRCSRRMRVEAPASGRHFTEQVLPDWLTWVEQERTRDLAALDEDALHALLDQVIDRVMHDFAKESLKPGFHGGLALSRLEGLFLRMTDQATAANLARSLTSALEGDITWEQDHTLAQVAGGTADISDFMVRFGHRASGEMELSQPRWHEDPAALDAALDQARRAGLEALEERHQATAARRIEAEEALDETLRAWGGRILRSDIDQQLALARELLPYREKGKYYLMMGYDVIRRILLEIGRRHDLGPDLFFLTRAELRAYPQRRDELTVLIAQRRLRHASAQRLDLPPVIDSDALDRLGLPDEGAGGEERDGIAVSSGVATGPAALVFDPREAGDLGTDYVLVCPSTDPGWTPLFIGAKALVVERGGTLSHGAIVARDFGIPAVTLPQATRWLAPGDVVRVDGNRGRVTRIERGDG